jgi:two-component system, NtrC family, sensor histidine kinase HydH
MLKHRLKSATPCGAGDRLLFTLTRISGVSLNRQMVFQVMMPALLVALAMFGMSLLGIRSINHLQADRDKIISEHGARLHLVQELATRMRLIRLHSFIYVMDMTPERWNKVAIDQGKFELAMAKIHEAPTDDQERPVIETIEYLYTSYLKEVQETKKSPPTPDRESHLKWFDNHPGKPVVDACDELLEINRKALTDTAEESARAADRSRTQMILLGIVGAVGGLVGGFGVAWGLSRSITRLSVRLQDVHAHLDHEVASLRLTAEGGNLQAMERQVATILKRVQEVVRQIQRQEGESLRAEQLAAVGQLAASIAHEVRNPLTSIKLLVGAALNGRYPKGLSNTDLQVIHDEVGRLERKVQSLLDFARPLESEPHTQDIAGIVHQVLDLVQERLRQQGVHLHLDIPEKPLTAELDRDQFQGVLVNLIFNALDAMPGGGRLDLRLECPVPGRLQITVADTGPGIDASVADRLFTPFTSTKATGTGLGLSVSRRVVEAHGGQLTASNRDGGGACFTVNLPAA